jgi:DNA polymerase-1
LEEDLLAHYIDVANNNGSLALDTETSSLDPISCIMAGASFYTPDLKPAYCPINHVSYASGNRIEKQLSPEIMVKHLGRLKDDVKLIFHNAKFDLRVIRNQLKLDMFKYLWWDTMIASCLLNENEDHGLKYQYGTYCNKEDVAKYKELFNDIPFHFIPVKNWISLRSKRCKNDL